MACFRGEWLLHGNNPQKAASFESLETKPDVDLTVEVAKIAGHQKRRDGLTQFPVLQKG